VEKLPSEGTGPRRLDTTFKRSRSRPVPLRSAPDVGMTSDMTWQARGGRPQPLRAAREAARRSGMSVGEWLDSVSEESGRQEGVSPARNDGDRRREATDNRQRGEDPGAPERYAEVSAKLDTLSQQLERLAATSAAIGVAKTPRDDDQITSALSQLDRR